MSDPLPSFTDDFNRSNGGLGANWVTIGGNTPVIASSLPEIEIDPKTPPMMTLLCSGCREPVGMIGGVGAGTVGVLVHVEFECGACGETTVFHTG